MTKIASKGTALQLDIAAVFTTIAQVMEIKNAGTEVETTDVTALDSGVGREKLATGFVEGGTVGGSGYLDPVAATHQAMTDLITAPSSDEDWKIILSDAASTEWTFTGTLKTFVISAAVGEPLKFDYDIEINGIITYPT